MVLYSSPQPPNPPSPKGGKGGGLILYFCCCCKCIVNDICDTLKEALDKKLKRILVITDSNLVYKFMRGTLDITKEHLVPLAKEISALASEFDAIYISHVKSHENDVFENVTADALCTWARDHEHDLRYEISKQSFNPATFSGMLHKTSGAPLDTDCTFCHLSHLESTCCLKIFSTLIPLHSKRSPCLACLSPNHSHDCCPLFAISKRRPAPSLFTPESALPFDDQEALRAHNLFTADLCKVQFPNNCSRKQFLDYYLMIFTGFAKAAQDQHVHQSVKAAQLWRDSYYFDGDCIRRSKQKDPDKRNLGTNLNPQPQDFQADLAKRALRAAYLLPYM